MGYYSAAHHPAQAHTAHIHTHIQMRSVAEGFKLSSVLSSAEVKPDCSNKGGPELQQGGSKLELKALREVNLTAEGKWEALLLGVIRFIC